MKRKIAIVAYSRERLVRTAISNGCPVCGAHYDLLTTAQAASLVCVTQGTIRRWIRNEEIQAVRTPGGRHRVCMGSLFQMTRYAADKNYPKEKRDEKVVHIGGNSGVSDDISRSILNLLRS